MVYEIKLTKYQKIAILFFMLANIAMTFVGNLAVAWSCKRRLN